MAGRDCYIGSLYMGIFHRQTLCRYEPAGVLSGNKYTGMVLVGQRLRARAQGSGQKIEDSPFEEPVPLQREGQGDVPSFREKLKVTRLNLKTGIWLTIVFVFLYSIMWLVLDRLTDSPVPAWDSFITSLSIIATWMLARKIYEHWFLWIVVNIAAAVLFFHQGTVSDSNSIYCILCNVVCGTDRDGKKHYTTSHPPLWGK